MNECNRFGELASHYVNVDGLKIHYLSSGEGHPVLFVHGWPTNAKLWRNIMPEVAKNRRAIAIDLPGFGLSDKPTDIKYTFKFYLRIITGFIDALGLEKLDLVVHDLGGPVGLYWAVNNPEKVSSLVILNTLFYSELSWAAKLFLSLTHVPIINSYLVSQNGLDKAMRIGVNRPSQLSAEVISIYQNPYVEKNAKLALLKSVQSLHPKGLAEIENRLDTLDIPIRIVYGKKDRILPDIRKTVNRFSKERPDSDLIQVTALKDCGHFLQEDKPFEVAQMISSFLKDVELTSI